MVSQKPKETLFFGLVAFVLTGALWRVLSGTTDGSLDGDFRTQVILASLYAGVLLFVLKDFRWTSWLMLRTPALCALLAVAGLSFLWAEKPDLVFRRSISLLGTSLFGVVLAAQFTFDEQLRTLRGVFRLAATACLALLAVAPSHAMARGGVPRGGGAARGIFTHKNLFGAAMALGILVEWYLTESRGLARVARYVALFLYSVLLVLSHSATSVVTVAATLGILWLFEKFHRRHQIPLPVLMLFFLAIVVCVSLFGIDASVFTEMLGRSSDLTGRTDLWKSVGERILSHPFLGFGISGFWGGASAESYAVESYIGWSPTYSHNGYLEILLSLGMVGMGLFLIFLWTGLQRALRLAEHKASKQDLWPLAFFVFFIIHNLAECSIVWQNCLEWSLCIATVIGADPEMRAIRQGSEESGSIGDHSDHEDELQGSTIADPQIIPTLSAGD